MRPAAELLLVERDAIRPLLETASPDRWDLPTVCDGWSVRDVLAHCSAALTMTMTGDLHRFTPEDNQRDVDERRSWPMTRVLDELFAGYTGAADAIDRTGGILDGIGLGEWVHGGDVREPLGAPDPYTSAGVDLAVGLLLERSVQRGAPAITVHLEGRDLPFGSGERDARLDTDVETFVRLTSGRRPDSSRYRLVGAAPGDLNLFG